MLCQLRALAYLCRGVPHCSLAQSELFRRSFFPLRSLDGPSALSTIVMSISVSHNRMCVCVWDRRDSAAAVESNRISECPSFVQFPRGNGEKKYKWDGDRSPEKRTVDDKTATATVFPLDGLSPPALRLNAAAFFLPSDAQWICNVAYLVMNIEFSLRVYFRLLESGEERKRKPNRSGNVCHVPAFETNKLHSALYRLVTMDAGARVECDSRLNGSFEWEKVLSCRGQFKC